MKLTHPCEANNLLLSFITLILFSTIASASFGQNTIQGGIWLESGNTGDGVYTGPPDDKDISETVQLYSDDDCDGSLTNLLDEFDIVPPGDMGYVFEDLADGCYVVIIGEEAFQTGGSLATAEMVDLYEDANVLVDHDNNGFIDGPIAKTASIDISGGVVNDVDFGLRYNCDEENPLASAVCSEAEVICNLAVLDGFCGTMSSVVTGNGPTPLCDGNGVPQNITWFAFVAGDGDWTLQINVYACSSDGIQMGIYDSCDWSNNIWCDSDCGPIEPINIESSIFEVGQIYWVFMDGCTGGICTYEVNILGAYIEADLNPYNMCIVDVGDTDGDGICNGTTICPEAELTFEVIGVPEMLDYTWSITKDGILLDIIDTDNTALIHSFQEVGSYTVCIDEISNECPGQTYYGSICQEVIVEEWQDEVFDDVYVCTKEFPYSPQITEDPNGDGIVGWECNPIGLPIPPSESITVVCDTETPSGCEYSQSITVHELENMRQNIYIIACGSADYHGYEITESISNIPFDFPSAASNGCDSLVSLSATIISVDAEMIIESCSNDIVTLGLKDFVSNPESSDSDAVFNFTWSNLATSEIICEGSSQVKCEVLDYGEYCLSVSINYMGEACSFDIGCIEVNEITIFPVTPDTEDWSLNLCYNIETSELSINDSYDFYNYNWTSLNASILEGQGTDSVLVDWDIDKSLYEICVEASNGCGASLMTCKEFVRVEDTYVPYIQSVIDICRIGNSLTPSEINLNGFLSIGTVLGNWIQVSGPSISLPIISADHLSVGEILIFKYENNCQETDFLTVNVVDCCCDQRIMGSIIYDANDNCAKENDENLGWSNILLKAESDQNTFYTFTDENGGFEMEVYAEEYLLSVEGGLDNSLFCNLSDFQNIEIQSLQDTTICILTKDLENCIEPEVILTIPQIRKCAERSGTLTYCNNNLDTVKSAYVILDFGDWIQLIYSDLDFTEQGLGIYRIELGDIPPFQCFDMDLGIDASCEEELVLDQSICMTAEIFPKSNCQDITNYHGAIIDLDQSCNGEFVEFKLLNIGNEDMQQPQMAYVYRNDIKIKEITYQLSAGHEYTYVRAADGATYTILTDQISEYPYSGKISTFIEGCTPEVLETHYGFGNLFHLNDQQPDFDIECRTVRNSYDPNDKKGTPMGIRQQNYVHPNQEIEYLIRFENIGNDTAFIVRIEDFIDPRMDLNTLDILSSSHNFQFRNNRNKLIFEFPDINLTSKSVDSIQANGFIKFLISPQQNIPLGSKVYNQASIHFDQNSPIITNATCHTFSDECFDENLNPFQLPTIQVQNWDLFPCEFAGDMAYTIEEIGQNVQYSWEVIGADTSMENGNELMVDWGTAGLGSICVYAFDSCSNTDTICHAIFVQSEPEAVEDVFLANPTNLDFNIILNDNLDNVSDFKISLMESPLHGLITIFENGLVRYTPFEPEMDIIDEFEYEVCNSHCSDLCSSAPVVINYDNDISDINDTNFDITDLLHQSPCELNIFNITGQKVLHGASCEEALTSIRSGELLAGIYCYQVILDDGRVVYGSFIMM